MPPTATLRGGRYQIEKALGKGGFGITYRAMDTEFERIVAIKEYFPTSYAHRDPNTGSLTVTTDDVQSIEKGLESFRREGRHLARVEHPNIPTVYDRFDENNTSYMVMEFLEGKSLKQVMQGKPLPVSQVAQIMEALVSALAATHAQGIHHLDIKPDNVIVQSNGRVVLIDFGAARQGTTFGDTSIAAMTPGYAPLELQARQAYGPETDIFELGMMMHQMLTGKLPPSANERLLIQHHWEPEGVEEPWRSLIIEATQLRQEDRPSDVRVWWYRTDAAATSSTSGSVKTIEGPGVFGIGPNRGTVTPHDAQTVPTPPNSGRGGRGDDTVIGGPGTVMAGGTGADSSEKDKPNMTVISVGIGAVAVAALIGFFAFAGNGKQPVSSASPSVPVVANNNAASPTPAAATPEPTPQGPTTADKLRATNDLKVILGKIPETADKELPRLLEQVKTLVESGADVDVTNNNGVAALHFAAALGEEEIADFLLDRRANPNIRDSEGLTPLHYVALGGSEEVCSILLKRKANPKAKNAQGQTPLQVATEYDNGGVAKLLKAKM
ncbi:MAG: hypothetical protein OHK0029_25340 [Armatimonadaceae bacterium]